MLIYLTISHKNMNMTEKNGHVLPQKGRFTGLSLYCL